MTDDANVAGIRAVTNQAIEEIGRMQSAIGVAKDRGIEVRRLLTVVLDGSEREETATAQVQMFSADQSCDEAIAATLIAVESLQTWLATR